MSDAERLRDYIRIRVQMLGSALGRKTNADLLDIFHRHLSRFTIGTLRRAFDKAEGELERFPTPHRMAEIAAGFLPSSMWKYDYRDIKATDPETGATVDAKRDPENGETLYRREDCPEGRAFLAFLKALAQTKPQARTDALAAVGSRIVEGSKLRATLAEAETHLEDKRDENLDLGQGWVARAQKKT
jgi:hypothetical protein